MIRSHLFRLLFVSITGVLAPGCATADAKRDAQPTAPAAASKPRSAPEVDEPFTTLATVRSVRKVAMFYRLDLREGNAHSPAMARVLQLHDARLRGCYVNRLEQAPGLRGKVTLAFTLSKATGAMRRILHVSGTIKDKHLVRCLKDRLASLPFTPPRDLRGTLTYQFDISEPVVVAPDGNGAAG